MRWGTAGGPVCRPYGEQQDLSRNGGSSTILKNIFWNWVGGGPRASRQDTHRERWLRKPRRMSGTAAAAIFANPGPSGPAWGPGKAVLWARSVQRPRPRWRFVQSLVTPGKAQRSGFAGKRRSKGTNAVFAVRRKRSGVDFATTSCHGQSNSPPAGGETPPSTL